MTERVRVLVVAPYDRVVFDLLGADDRFEVEYAPCTSVPEIASRAGSCRVLVTRSHNRITRQVIESAPMLELIVQGASGLDNIDQDAADERGIRVVGVPGANANAVAELVIGLMIALTRSVGWYDRSVRRGDWLRDDCSSRRELRAHRLGIVGLGRVGSSVARLAASFGVSSKAFDPYLRAEDFELRGTIRVERFDDLVSSSDILSLHVPLTHETRGMIGRREIALLPPGAIVINTSRGPVVVLSALLDALAANRIGGAALDVFDPEPPTGVAWPDDPRLILTPHVAGCTGEARQSIGRMVYEAIAAGPCAT